MNPTGPTAPSGSAGGTDTSSLSAAFDQAIQAQMAIQATVTAMQPQLDAAKVRPQ
jgi:hypothetical protein